MQAVEDWLFGASGGPGVDFGYRTIDHLLSSKHICQKMPPPTKNVLSENTLHTWHFNGLSKTPKTMFT